MDATGRLLKELTEAHGVPGYEAPIRAVLRKHLDPLGSLSQDKLGNLLCEKRGSVEAPRVMLAAHMDEIGFMVKHITKEGFLKFLPLGGWFAQVVLGQRVVVKTRQGDVVGVIGAKPPHMLTPEERNKVVKLKDMYIDVGATSKEEVESIGVRVGDPVIPQGEFVPLASGKTFMSKAFDDRVGLAVMIATLRELANAEHPNTVVGVATVQEEVGTRGAKTSAWSAEPDIAIVLESDIAGDVPGIKPEESAIELGAGPSLLIYDARMIPNLKLRDFVIDTASELSIPLQLSYVEGGATDGAMIHVHKTGVPTVVLSVAARHIHSDSSIIHRRDFEQAVALLTAVLKRLDRATVEAFTE